MVGFATSDDNLLCNDCCHDHHRNEFKTTLIEKDKKDQKEKIESLLYDIEVKDKR